MIHTLEIMKNLTYHDSRITFFVESKHGQSLEFVLAHAQDRTGNNYYDLLNDMLNDALGDLGYCDDLAVYGHVNCNIIIPKYQDIPKVLELCDNTIGQWLARYNINKMLDNVGS